MNENTDNLTNYFHFVQEQLGQVLEAQQDAMMAVARTWADAIQQDKLLYSFGSGHSRYIAGELHWRAGGLAPVMLIDDPAHGDAERLEGYAATFMAHYGIEAGDLLVVISNSGINPVPLEVALYGQEAGATVVAVTSMSHSRNTPPRHSSGKRLFEIADLVIDTMGTPGDAAIALPGRDWRVSPTSTVVSTAILNAVVAQTAQILNEAGVTPPALISANVPEGDEHNAKLKERYRHRLVYYTLKK